MTDQRQLFTTFGRVVIKSRRGRKTTCHCGTCQKCKHRDYMREYYYGVRRGKPLAEHRRPSTKNGYVEVYLLPDDPLYSMANRGHGAILEHRLVMARHLGRPLDKNEVVHHRNGDRADNRLENLELWVKGHPTGQRLEEKLAWAMAFVRRYGKQT